MKFGRHTRVIISFNLVKFLVGSVPKFCHKIFFSQNLRTDPTLKIMKIEANCLISICAKFQISKRNFSKVMIKKVNLQGGNP